MKTRKIDELLKSSTKEELIFMMNYLINEYDGLEEKLLFKYVKLDEEDEIKKNKKYLSDMTKKYGSGRRFISRRECGNYANEVLEILDNSRDYSYDTNKPLVAIETAIAVIAKMISAIQYMDDSDGDIGEVINRALYLIDEICIGQDEFSGKDRKKIFDKIINEANNKIYNGWEELRLEIFNNGIYFCDDRKLKVKFEDKLDELYNMYADDWSGKYNKQKLLQIKLDIITKYGTEEEEEEFIKNNINYSEFREIFIKRCIENKDYNKVLEVAEEGENQDKQHSGLILKWEKYKYLAYKSLDMKEEQKVLAKKLFFSGEMMFYDELKELCINEWDDYYLKIKTEFKEKNITRLNIYSQMLIKENDLEELLELTKGDVRKIEEFDKLLIKDYKEDVNVIYKYYIDIMSKCASDRSNYKNVCKIIKKYSNLYGDIATYKITTELKKKYPRRPAFIDELNKI